MGRIIRERNVLSPDGNPLGEVKSFNLMVETSLGSSADSKESTFLRGETCQGIFVNFKNIVDTARVGFPFGVLQIGKAFRNEITARQFVIRTREFEQMEFEFFFNPSDGVDWYRHWQDKFMDLLTKEVGLARERLRFRELPPEEMSHYAKKQCDIEFLLPNGDWIELSPMNHRGNWDLSRHSEYSGVKLEYRDPETGEKFLPSVIETSFGVGRLLYVLMDHGIKNEELQNGDSRTVLKIHPGLAPYTCAILPLSKKDSLIAAADELERALCRDFSVDYDTSGSIGKRYRRQDEIGTPWCVTVDFDTLEDKKVTIRDRDSMEQTRIPIADVPSFLRDGLRAASS